MYWYEIPGRDEEWKKDQLEAIGFDINTWNQEYDIMFLEEGTSAFNLKLIEEMKKRCCQPEYSFDDGDYKIWEEPKPDHIYTIGVDVSEGVGQDYSVAQVLDITDPLNIVHSASFASNRLSPYVFAEKLNQIARSWGRPFLCIERNKEGGQVVDALWEVHKYDNIIHYTMDNDKRNAYQNLGIFCHTNSKYTGITNMQYYVGTIKAFKSFDLNTVKEFETFVRKDTASNRSWGAKKGHNDDRIMALIWGLIVLEKKIAERYFDILEYDDTGRPVKISDPNQDLANKSFYDKEGFDQYSSVGGMPLPVFYQRGSVFGSEMETVQAGGWRIL
jgi:hypothetical protein